MKNILKKVLLLCLFVSSAIAIGLFAACDDGENKTATMTYTVTVKDDGNTPIKDVGVIWAKGTNKYLPVKTDADGKATMELTPDTYTITLVAATLPDGYSAPENIEVTKDNASVTVKLIKDFRYTVKLVNEDGTPFYHENVMLAICQLEGNCLTPAPLGTDGTWIMTDVDPGDYKVQIVFPEDIEGTYSFDGSDVGHYYTSEYFSATKTELTITIKAVSSQLTVDAAGKKKITVKNATEYAYVKFVPAKTGVYEICSEGDFDTYVKYSNSQFITVTGEDDDGGEGKNFKLGGLEIQAVGQNYEFRIYVKEGASFPATFDIKITRTGDAAGLVQREFEKITPTQLGDDKFGEGNGVFTAIDVTVAQTPVKDNNGIYHIGTVDGDVLVAKLSGSIRGLGNFTDENGSGFVVTFINVDDETKGWDYIDFWKAYTEKCNSDGVYPVNEELKTMLKHWADEYIIQYKDTPNSVFTNLGVAEGNEWLIPCGYYSEQTTPPEKREDVIIGEYVMEGFMGNNKTLTVKDDGTFSITEGTHSNNGTWDKNENGTYSFTEDFGYEKALYTVIRDGETGKLTFYDIEMDPDMEVPAYEFQVPTPAS